MLHPRPAVPPLAGALPLADTALRLRTARPDDWTALCLLLGHAGVSPAGVQAHLASTLVLERGNPRDDRGDLLGCVTIEHGRAALLHSLVVTPDSMARGYDTLLLDLALQRARDQGAQEAVLLVETATQIPARRLESVPWPLLRGACPQSARVHELSSFDSTALAMRLPLRGPTREPPLP